MKPIIFDSSALLSYFFGEEGTEEVQKLLKAAVQEKALLLLSPVNFGEIYYIVSRREDEDKAQAILRMLDELFFEMPSVDVDTAIQAAKLKAKHGLGYADSFAAALTLKQDGELVTKDEDFKTLEKEIKIHWI